jgi:hypothetical protein
MLTRVGHCQMPTAGPWFWSHSLPCFFFSAQGAARRCFDILVVVVGHASAIVPSQGVSTDRNI